MLWSISKERQTTLFSTPQGGVDYSGELDDERKRAADEINGKVWGVCAWPTVGLAELSWGLLPWLRVGFGELGGVLEVHTRWSIWYSSCCRSQYSSLSNREQVLHVQRKNKDQPLNSTEHTETFPLYFLDIWFVRSEYLHSLINFLNKTPPNYRKPEITWCCCGKTNSKLGNETHSNESSSIQRTKQKNTLFSLWQQNTCSLMLSWSCDAARHTCVQSFIHVIHQNTSE